MPPILLKGISETELRQYAEAVRPAINKVLGELGSHAGPHVCPHVRMHIHACLAHAA